MIQFDGISLNSQSFFLTSSTCSYVFLFTHVSTQDVIPQRKRIKTWLVLHFSKQLLTINMGLDENKAFCYDPMTCLFILILTCFKARIQISVEAAQIDRGGGVGKHLLILKKFKNFAQLKRQLLLKGFELLTISSFSPLLCLSWGSVPGQTITTITSLSHGDSVIKFLKGQACPKVWLGLMLGDFLKIEEGQDQCQVGS